MKTVIDCYPCFVRQIVEVTALAGLTGARQEKLAREILHYLADADFAASPPQVSQVLYRMVRECAGFDPFAKVKAEQNQGALDMLPAVRAKLAEAPDPWHLTTRLAIAGNVIDLGISGHDGNAGVDLERVLDEPFCGDTALLRQAVNDARSILYLADNAGEIVFDRLLIEQLPRERLTVAVRGGPIINDATMEDARRVGLPDLVPVIDNGSDAPGTVLADCSEAFGEHYARADLIIAKGQGNYETLSDEPRNIFFLFKVKCPVIARHSGLPLGTHVLRSAASPEPACT